MRSKWLLFSLTFLLLFGCPSRKGEMAIPNVVIASQNTPDQMSQVAEHYSVKKSELVDRTAPEEHFAKPSYDNGNGTVLSFSEANGKKMWRRKFIDTIDVETYEFADKQFLYTEPDSEKIVCKFQNKDKLSSSEVFVIVSEKSKATECWIKVTDGNRHEGWVYVGSDDPYFNSNWAIIGSVETEGNRQLLRRYSGIFSTWGTQAAYNEPSTSGKILWHTLRTDGNDQINLTAICVTDKTYQGKYFLDHWVKVEDSYGRIGWLPGDALDVERGGPKYITPEAVVEHAFYGA